MLSCTAYSKGQVEKSYHKDNTFGIFTLVFTMQIKESFNILISFHFISFHYFISFHFRFHLHLWEVGVQCSRVSAAQPWVEGMGSDPVGKEEWRELRAPWADSELCERQKEFHHTVFAKGITRAWRHKCQQIVVIQPYLLWKENPEFGL